MLDDEAPDTNLQAVIDAKKAQRTSLPEQIDGVKNTSTILHKAEQKLRRATEKKTTKQRLFDEAAARLALAQKAVAECAEALAQAAKHEEEAKQELGKIPLERLGGAEHGRAATHGWFQQ